MFYQTMTSIIVMNLLANVLPTATTAWVFHHLLIMFLCQVHLDQTLYQLKCMTLAAGVNLSDHIPILAVYISSVVLLC